MDFKTAYQQAINCEGFHSDPAQAQAVEQLDTVYKNLLNHKNNLGVLRRVWSKFDFDSRKAAACGCYLWGDVGRGKTWLMDLFYQSLPYKDKSRLHFHEFMQQIHFRLKAINGQRDPLVSVAAEIAHNHRLICLDEFQVSDITDAMLLYGLLDALYRKGTVLLMTSNSHPDELYKNGLQRDRFLPAIELIKNHNLVVQVNGDDDFRLLKSQENLNYISPLSEDSDQILKKRFSDLARGEATYDSLEAINNRVVAYNMKASNIIWFEFNELCGGPRAASDYLYLAKNYDYVIVSNVFRMDERHDDMVKRFINLVDALYDRQVGLIVSADVWPAEIYEGKRFKNEIKRTISRLEEIRSSIYRHFDRSMLHDKNSLLSSG